MVRPDARGDGGPEGLGRVHGGAGQGGAGDGVAPDEEAGEQRASAREQLPRVQDGGVDDDEQAKGEDGLRHHTLQRVHAIRQRVHWRGGATAATNGSKKGP